MLFLPRLIFFEHDEFSSGETGILNVLEIKMFATQPRWAIPIFFEFFLRILQAAENFLEKRKKRKDSQESPRENEKL